MRHLIAKIKDYHRYRKSKKELDKLKDLWMWGFDKKSQSYYTTLDLPKYEP